MKKILVATTNNDLIKVIQDTLQNHQENFTAFFKTDIKDIVNYINFEMPEIKILDFSSVEIDTAAILQEVHNDPWLHYGGIIAIAGDKDSVKKIEEKKDTNILIVQTIADFTIHFARVLRILWSNQQFLFNRGFQDKIAGEESGNFVCVNDPLDINFYSVFLVNYLYNTNKINEDGSRRLYTALKELMLNALEHGNCEISYGEKRKVLAQGGDVFELIKNKAKKPEVAAKRIYLSYNITSEKTFFSIRDEGSGFDWQAILNTEIKPGLNGMGIKIAQGMILDLHYNEKGNEALFAIENQQNKTSAVPSIMTALQVQSYNDKDVVCHEHESTTDLFFIVSGEFKVYRNSKLISTITANDIFIGEMSFLLDNHRSATVVSLGASKLIPISKDIFLMLIKHNPHYGVFLSRLLARRLHQQTQTALNSKNFE